SLQRVIIAGLPKTGSYRTDHLGVSLRGDFALWPVSLRIPGLRGQSSRVEVGYGRKVVGLAGPIGTAVHDSGVGHSAAIEHGSHPDTESRRRVRSGRFRTRCPDPSNSSVPTSLHPTN